MEPLLSAVAILARPDVIAALVAGSVGGVVIGAIPGVGPAAAIAILLPATFAFDPIVGLTLLLGVYGAAMFGGALPAILINTPGTAANALTTWDGYPMAQRGEARRALGLACSASLVGGTVSVLCLVALAPLLAAVAPLFGSREIFLAALLGLVLAVLAHRGQVAAAGLLAGIGMLLATVGLEPVSYAPRFTFGQPWLAGGVELVAVVLGLFAVSQALVLLTGPDTVPHPGLPPGRRLAGLAEVARHRRTALTSAGCGVVMGILPGVGEFSAQFLAYGWARRRSPVPETFGRGAPEGIIASEAANNAVPAAAMIPLLALGVPGEALTAMMLSVFYLHGVAPGPRLFAEQLDFVLALYLALLLLNLIAFATVLAATGPILRLVAIPARFLGAVVLTLAFVGTFALRNSFADCVTAGIFGLVGYTLRRIGLPRIPIVLGMVLGAIMETRFRTAMLRVETPLDFFSRPLAALLGLAILLALGTAIRRR